MKEVEVLVLKCVLNRRKKLHWAQSTVSTKSQAQESPRAVNPNRLKNPNTAFAQLTILLLIYSQRITRFHRLLKKSSHVMIAKNWHAPTALRSGIIAAAFFIFPLGVIVVQDFEGIEQRLGGAVEAAKFRWSSQLDAQLAERIN